MLSLAGINFNADPATLERVNKGAELISSGSLTWLDDYRFQIDSPDAQEPFVVTIGGCRCFDFVIDQINCEHIWAAIGAAAAILIIEIEGAKSPLELTRLMQSRRRVISSLPDSYADAVWQTSRSRACEITARN